LRDDQRARKQRLLAEEFGLLYEEMGGTRMAGRITAWLLLCEPPVQSLTAIADALGVSKAAVSTSVRSLLQAGLVERVSEPGRRGDHYRYLPGHLDSVLRMDRIDALSSLVHRCLDVVAERDHRQWNYAVLRDLSDFLDFLKTEIPGLIERWNARSASRPAESVPASSTDRGGTP
jgi:predicted transcriptional regulator